MRDERGFSLIEALVALVVVAGVLLGGLGLFWQQRAATRRLRAHRGAEIALENVYERLRSGALELAPGPIPTESGPPLALTLEPGDAPGTLVLDITALYELDGRPCRRALRALVREP